MISQIVTLVGVLVGALTSYLSVTLAERAKHRRTMATRWDQQSLVLLADPKAVEAAHDVNVALWEILAKARAHEPSATVRRLSDLLNSYHERAREDLGIGKDAWQTVG
ncbi:hypothetical protein [Streptomyces sp. NPDC002078]